MGLFDFLKKKKDSGELKAVVSGTVIPVTKVTDDVFSSCMLGKGIAIHPDSDEVVAPIDGVISVTMEGTNHAVGIRVKEGFDLLIHIGIDTVSLNGEGFTSHISMGQKIKAGERLITMDRTLIRRKGFCDDVILIALDNPALPALEFRTGMKAAAGETVVATW